MYFELEYFHLANAHKKLADILILNVKGYFQHHV